MSSVVLSLFAGAGWQFFTNDGIPLAGGLLYTYVAGTTTPQVTYTTSAGIVAHPNPIVLDSAGKVPTGEIWTVNGSNYKFVLKDASNVTIATYDNIQSGVYASDVIYTSSYTGGTQQTVAGKLDQTISIFDFLSASEIADISSNTGVLDVSTKVQNALAAIPATDKGYGCVLMFPPGTYKLASPIIINQDIVISGYGARINSSGSRCFDIGNAAYISDITIGNLYVKICGLSIFHTGANEVIRNQGIRTVVLEDLYVYGGLHSFYSEGAFGQSAIRHCRFLKATSHGINLAQRNNMFAISNTSVLATAGYGIHLNTGPYENKNIKLDEVDIEGCAGAVYIAGNTGGVSLDTCWFENNTVFNIKVDNTAGTFNKYNININNCQITGAGVDVIIGTDPAGTLIDGIQVTGCEFVDSKLSIISWDLVKNIAQHSNRRSAGANFIVDSSIDLLRIGRGNGGAITNTVYGINSGNSLDQSTGLGYQNVFVGYQAGYYCTTGYNNAFVGRHAGVSVTTGYANVAIGNRAMENASTNYASVAVGNATLTAITSGTGNTAIGANAGATLTTTADAVVIGINAFNGSGITAMDRCIAIGKEAGVLSANGSSDSIIIGTQTNVTGSNAIAIGTSITAAANTVRIGNSSITSIGGYQPWTNLSDARYKTDVQGLTLGLDFLKSLRPVSYKLISGNQKEDWGFIAQEIEEALQGREANIIEREQNEEGTYRLRSADLIAVSVKAIQELSDKVQALESTIAELQRKIQA